MKKGSFDIDSIFCSNVPQIERDMLRRSDALMIAVQLTGSVPQLRVSRVYYPLLQSRSPQVPWVIFSNKDGIETVLLGYRDGTWSVSTSEDVLKNDWRVYAQSKRPGYLAKAVTNKKTEVHQGILNVLPRTWVRQQHEMVKTLINNARHRFTNSRRTSVNFRDMLTTDQMGTLLSVYLGELSSGDVPAEHRQTFDTVRHARDKARNVSHEVTSAMQEMFGQPKWLISYVPDKEYSVSGVDMSLKWMAAMSYDAKPESHYDITHPLLTTRSLDDMPVGIKERIMGALTMNKLHMRNRYPGIKYGVEPDDMVPTNVSDLIVCEELGSMVLTMEGATVIMVNQ